MKFSPVHTNPPVVGSMGLRPAQVSSTGGVLEKTLEAVLTAKTG